MKTWRVSSIGGESCCHRLRDPPAPANVAWPERADEARVLVAAAVGRDSPFRSCVSSNVPRAAEYAARTCRTCVITNESGTATRLQLWRPCRWSRPTTPVLFGPVPEILRDQRWVDSMPLLEPGRPVGVSSGLRISEAPCEPARHPYLGVSGCLHLPRRVSRRCRRRWARPAVSEGAGPRPPVTGTCRHLQFLRSQPSIAGGGSGSRMFHRFVGHPAASIRTVAVIGWARPTRRASAAGQDRQH